MRTVYLAGPITGTSFGECTDWRNYAVEELAKAGIKGISPMRAKDYLKNEAKVSDAYEDTVLSCSRGIMTRDRWDCTHCDVLLVNFLGAEKVSIGTCMEIAWADLNRIPVILVIDPSGSPHDHSMIREAAGFRVTTLDAGINVAKAILTAYGDK